MNEKLTNLMHRGAQFLGCPYAILGGAMTWVSNPDLVAAISEAGAFGVLAGGAMEPDLLEKTIEETKQKTAKPFGVNLITMHPQLTELIATCARQKVSHLFLAGGIPTAGAIAQAKAGGMRTICFAPMEILARKLLRNGADALVIEGSEAGGHIGMLSTIVLIQEVLLNMPEVPIFVAGGIARGEMLTHALLLGACGIQLGTLFAAALESPAHPDFKKSFFRASAKDAQSSAQLDSRFPVIPVRGLINKGVGAFYELQRDIVERYENGQVDLKEGQITIEKFWAGALRRAAIDGDTEHGSLMAGQSVGFVKEERSVADIIKTLLQEAENALTSITRKLSL